MVHEDLREDDTEDDSYDDEEGNTNTKGWRSPITTMVTLTAMGPPKVKGRTKTTDKRDFPKGSGRNSSFSFC